MAATGAYVRFEVGIPEALKETVIITAAKELGNQYEFSAHARLARAAGTPEETIKAIAQGTAPDGLSGDAEMLVRYTQQLVRNNKISDSTDEQCAQRRKADRSMPA